MLHFLILLVSLVTPDSGFEHRISAPPMLSDRANTGPGWDPNGKPTAETGPGWDPNGGDLGPDWDPNG